MFDRDLTPYDFAILFGTDEDHLPQACLDLIEKYDFAHRIIPGGAA